MSGEIRLKIEHSEVITAKNEKEALDAFDKMFKKLMQNAKLKITKKDHEYRGAWWGNIPILEVEYDLDHPAEPRGDER